MSDDFRRDEEQQTEKRSRLIGMQYIDTSLLDEKPLYPEVLSPDEIKTFKIIPIRVDRNNILFGITTSTSKQTLNELTNRFTDQRVSFAIISDSGYRDYYKLYFPEKKIVYQDIKLSSENAQQLVQTISATLSAVKSDDILAYLVQQAYTLKASDIHLENQKDGLRIRFRVDGVLHSIANLSTEKYRQVISSIAIAANVSTQDPEPQSGHINRTYTLATGETVNVNLRVEVVPTAYGQDVVMRVFNTTMEMLDLNKLGLSDKERSVVDDIIRHPTGLVLVVGPTGSGKTTTLYSLINTLNNDERKILTLEDPIEYLINGIVQIPVAGDQSKSGFADKLRAVLRLDPDVIMVGEIRDQDTAKTALQAALTGHLVMSTFHASSSSAALTRMVDMIGINPLFASAIRLIMAQRLIRRLDDRSKIAYKPDENMKAHLKLIVSKIPDGYPKPDIDNITLYRAGQSPENPFGYSGQLALREQLRMTKSVQQVLKMDPSQITTELIEEKAIEDGMLTMLQDGILKVCAGITSIEEVYRVVDY
jgi:type II secretory ATPase GspE/PulE/Tfp pilus assembly ATPase PilB-like protein